MRVIQVGSRRFTKVVAIDGRGHGGACHEYVVVPAVTCVASVPDATKFAQVAFQNGPIKEAGINGCHHEDLLAMVIDRLESFQSGEYACDENHAALVDLRSALKRLRRRTDRRLARGVESTSQA